MKESTNKTVIETLAEAIERLQNELFLYKYENERLREKVAMYEKNTEEVGKDNA